MICCVRRQDLARAGAVWREAEIRIVEGAGHTLYDPGVRDAVMKAIADMASRSQMTVHLLILRSGVSRVSKDEATDGPHGSRRRKSASSP